MTGYQSKRAAAQDKLNDDDDIQVYKRPWVEPNGLAAHVIGCFGAAEAEGLQDALADTTDARLRDLVERLMHALYAALEIEGSK